MEIEGQQPQEPEAPAAPEAPPIDPRAALEIAAHQYGMTPDELESSIRLQDENRRVYEENRRRTRELELREAQIEALGRDRERYTPQEQPYEVDPAVRPVFDKVNALERIILEERRERADEARRMQEAQRLGQELRNHYESVMRSVPTQSRIDDEQFFQGMAQLYPEGPPPGMSAAVAVENAARYMGIRTNGPQPYRPSPYYGDPTRNPRAAIVIPGAPSSGAQPPPSMSDSGPQRAGETAEQYAQRLARVLQEQGIRGLNDGTRVSSG